MPMSLSPSEAAQLQEMIDMFEVIVESRPDDCESLDILKEAYSRLGRQQDVVNTSKRLAKAYIDSGHLSSAILEYESILQQSPADPEARAALAELENTANKFGAGQSESAEKSAAVPKTRAALDEADEARAKDDGREAMRKLFVEGRHISATDFDFYWPMVDTKESPKQASEPFIHSLAEKQLLPIEKSIKLICDKARLGYIPLDKYDVDIELARSFPRDLCLRWCILPFDRMGRSVLVATANPFNQRAARDLERASSDAGNKHRFLWYVASPAELLKILRKAFR